MEKETKSKISKADVVTNNLRFYLQGCEVPQDAIKSIQEGRLKGKSDINPMWRMKRMTEIFGPVGFGWRYEIVRQWTEAYGEVVKCFCNVHLYVRDPKTKEWSEPIPGSGGSAMVAKETRGSYVDDDAYKKALTDALSIAMKPLGIAANVWYGPKAIAGYEESKYEQRPQQPQQYSQPRQGYTNAAFTGEQLKAALADLAAAKTEQQFNDVWIKWQNDCPGMCTNGSEFWNACAKRIGEIRQTKAS